jgi:hypothetical protein
MWVQLPFRSGKWEHASLLHGVVLKIVSDESELVVDGDGGHRNIGRR